MKQPDIDKTLNEIDRMPRNGRVEIDAGGRGPHRTNLTTKQLQDLAAGYREKEKEREWMWMPIRTADDLPKETGKYLFQHRHSSAQEVRRFIIDYDYPPVDYFTRYYAAWMPIPPYTPDEGKEQGE